MSIQSVSEGLDRSREVALIFSAFWKAPVLILGKPKPLEMTVCESMNNYFFKIPVVSVLSLNSLPDGSTVCPFALETVQVGSICSVFSYQLLH